MEWSIQARSHQCQACGRGFRNKEVLHTLLRDERNAYVRMDVCAACWSAHYAEGANHQLGFVSCWRSFYASPAPPPPEPIRRETAETLLRKLVELNAPEHAGACFILAVMLERKRLLKVKSQTAEGDQRILVYEHPKTGDIFTILDPRLQLDQLEVVQRDVARLLEHGLDTPPSGGSAARGQPDTGAVASSPPPSGEAGEVSADGPADTPAESATSASSSPSPAAVNGEPGAAVSLPPTLSPVKQRTDLPTGPAGTSPLADGSSSANGVSRHG